MNKIAKISIGIAIVILAVILLEFSSYVLQTKRLSKQYYGYKNYKNMPINYGEIKTFRDYYFSDFNRGNLIANKTDKKYSARPVLIFGDVIVNSKIMPKHINFASRLSDEIKRPVFNLANEGWGIQHMYFLLLNEIFLQEIKPETVIYFYTSNQKNQLVSYSHFPENSYLNLIYDFEDSKLIEKNPDRINIFKSYFIKNAERYLGWRKSSTKKVSMQKENYELMEALFEQSKDLAKIKFPNLKKFIIIRYSNSWDTMKKLEQYKDSNEIANIEYNMWQKLKDKGFIIIDANELTNINLHNYRYHNLDDSFTFEAMDIIIPPLAKKAGLVAVNDKKSIEGQKTKHKLKQKSVKPLKQAIIKQIDSTLENTTIETPVEQNSNTVQQEQKQKKKFVEKLKFWKNKSEKNTEKKLIQNTEKKEKFINKLKFWKKKQNKIQNDIDNT